MAGLIERIARKAGVPDLVERLAERLSGSELQSLLLEVYERRARAGSAGELARRYEQDRFAQPATADPRALVAIDRLAFALLPEGFEAIELSPVAPLGASSMVADVSQKRIVSTARNSEVAADATNGLALECARRRAALLREAPRSPERVCLAASQRVLRAQPIPVGEAYVPHFRLLALCSAGRDEGSFGFELAALVEQLDYLLRLLAALREEGAGIEGVRVALAPFDPARAAALEERVLGDLAARHPDAELRMDAERERGRGYYRDACFLLHARTAAGEWLELGDGGLTDWTQQLVPSRKERLLIAGLGVERLATLF